MDQGPEQTRLPRGTHKNRSRDTKDQVYWHKQYEVEHEGKEFRFKRLESECSANTFKMTLRSFVFM